MDPEGPERYALIYGVSDYGNYTGSMDLNYTDDDAREIGRLLSEKGYEVHLRIDDGSNAPSYPSSFENASTEQLIDDFKMMKNILGKNDIFVFFFSGHGFSTNIDSETKEGKFSDSDDEYIVLYPTEQEYKAKDIYLADDTLSNAIENNLKSQKNVLLLDSCFSGGVISQSHDIDRIAPAYSSASEYRDDVFNSTLKAYAHSTKADISPREAVIISAAGEIELSWEGGLFGEHGSLSFGILESTRKGDENNDGYIDTGEIYNFTREYIETNWNSNWKSIQDSIESVGGSATQEEIQFMPRISGGPIDYILFEAD